MESKALDQHLKNTLDEVSRKGIRVQRDQLKKNICSQFPDYRLWIREYITNALDAGARWCRVTGAEEGDLITISVSDDGRGMNRDRLEAFVSKFRSVKDQPEHAIGRFGIGSFSVAAIPGQCGFALVTSTGEETWRMAAKSLLSDDPITLQRIEPARPRGTLFDVTFKQNGMGVADELNHLQTLARTYLRHLPIELTFEQSDQGEPERPASRAWHPANWQQDEGEELARRFCFNVGKARMDLVLAVGPQQQALYQNRVLITSNRRGYDLLSQDLGSEPMRLPHLSIRVDSPDFVLPLGRHCLADTSILIPLAREIRGVYLPRYLNELAEILKTPDPYTTRIPLRDIEDMISSYIAFHPERAKPFWDLPLFLTHDLQRVSLRALDEAVTEHQALFIADPEARGLDYDVFGAPVLSGTQPAPGIGWLKTYYREYAYNLSLSKLVMEAPPGRRPELSASEQRFSKMLGFHPEALSQYKGRRPQPGHPGGSAPGKPKRFLQRLTRETKQASRDLEDLRWNVGHLVGRDGTAPCTSVMYLCRNNTVTLNLHHAAIRQLVTLSEKAPDLAGHFAIALCLSETGSNTIMKHVPDDIREELINLDAICRCGSDAPPEAPGDGSGPHPEAPPEEDPPDSSLFRDFLRNLEREPPF